MWRPRPQILIHPIITNGGHIKESLCHQSLSLQVVKENVLDKLLVFQDKNSVNVEKYSQKL